jgi:hypothetical protein
VRPDEDEPVVLRDFEAVLAPRELPVLVFEREEPLLEPLFFARAELPPVERAFEPDERALLERALLELALLEGLAELEEPPLVDRRVAPELCEPAERWSLPSSCPSSWLSSFFATPTAAGTATPSAAPATTFFLVDMPSSSDSISSLLPRCPNGWFSFRARR